MTYRVLRLTCTTCNEERRVRCQLTVAGEVPEPCPGCGRSDYRDGAPTPPPELQVCEHSDGSVTVVNTADVPSFWSMFQAEQNEYIKERFRRWSDDVDATWQADRDAIESDRARMFRELWHVLEDGE